MKLKKIILQTLSILFILGGIIRLLATKSLFRLFFIDMLWVDHSYFVYIYRVLGSFVILTGLIIFTISRNIEKYSELLFILTIGFIIIGFVMMITGILTNLPLVFYFPDFVFCFIIAWYLNVIKTSL